MKEMIVNMDFWIAVIALASFALSIVVFIRQIFIDKKNSQISLFDKRYAIYQEFMFELDRSKKYRPELSKCKNGYESLRDIAKMDYQKINNINGAEFLFSNDIADGIKELHDVFVHVNFEIKLSGQDYDYSNDERIKLVNAIDKVDNPEFKTKLFDEVKINNQKKPENKNIIVDMKDDLKE